MLALYPGSFDPFHLGHLAVVEEAAHTFDEVIVAVVGNPEKPSGLLPIPDRIQLTRMATGHLDNVSCLGYHGLTVDLVRAVGAEVLIRCAHKDTGTERSMAAMNEAAAGVATFFATPDPGVRIISSSLIRSLVTSGETHAAMQLVPAAARSFLTNVLTRSSA